MTKTQRLNDIKQFVLTYLKYEYGSFIFTEHIKLLFCKKYYTVNKDRLLQDLCMILRSNKNEFGIPLHADINSNYCRDVSTRLFTEDNKFSNKALFNVTWIDPKKDTFCVDGQRFLYSYLELRQQRKSTSKSLYFQPEFSLKDFESEEGLKRITDYIRGLPEDSNLNHNKNLMFILLGLHLQKQKEIKILTQILNEIKKK